MSSVSVVVTVLLLLPFVALALLILLVRARRARAASDLARTATEVRLNQMEDRFRQVLEADAYATAIKAEADRISAEAKAAVQSEIEALQRQAATLTAEVANLRGSYADKRSVYDRLVSEVAVYDERLAFAELGIYQPHFDFNNSEKFKEAIEAVRQDQKDMASAKTAVFCTTTWQVDGSASKGKTMSDRAIKLTLRAFNNECEAAIANTRWNNVNAMIKRIEIARDQIDRLNQSNAVVIASRYAELKLKELRLVHEYKEKLKAEKEERADMARAAREEQRLLRDLEDAEREEAKFQKMLQTARNEAEQATGARLEAYSQKIEMLERDLAEAHVRAERAKAMAEMTRSGYVYVISNVGSFGPDVVKIGLTRRLDPSDRIRELGDASVPFLFDTHAMIYSDDAPGIERALHKEFDAQRINALNFRKEFFRVSLDEVESALRRIAPEASFFRDIEAQEFQETLAMRKATLTAAATTSEHASEFPAVL